MQRSFMLKKKEETVLEQKKFSEVEEIEKFESVLNEDIKKIRAKIDDVSKDFLELQKRFGKAEKEYLEAKVELFTKGEEKDRLVETLHGLIENCESHKAKKLSELLSKFEIKSKVTTENKSKNTTENKSENVTENKSENVTENKSQNATENKSENTTENILENK